jgi:20S proteasome alpha/beta subunit
MTLVVGLHCRKSIILGAEQEENTGIAAKRDICKLKLYESDHWAIGFGGAGDGAIIDNAERRLAEWLESRERFTGKQLSEAIEDVLATVYSKFIDPDPRSEGISLIIGASCEDGLFLIQTHKRVCQFQDSYACSGYGSDVATYLLERLYQEDDKWINALKIAAFSIYEVKNAAQYCSGDSNFLVFQNPPNPRWRDLGDGFGIEVENGIQGLIAGIRSKIIGGRWRPEWIDGYCDQFHVTGYEEMMDCDETPEETEKRFAKREELESQDE